MKIRLLALLLCSILVLPSSCDSNNPSQLSAERSDLSSMQRTLLAENLADPDVLKVDDDHFFVSGTGARPGSELPIYESNDLESFRFKRNYLPSLVDPAYDYCDLWAPDLSLRQGVYFIYFSARRVNKGQACPGSNPPDPTTYVATAPNADLNFGAPLLFQPTAKGPRSILTSGCPPEGCNKAIRIDAETFVDMGSTWFFYVWFDRGNNISSFRLNDPNAAIVDHAGPARFPTPADEEVINEGPALFKRGSKYYLFFSTGFFNSQYAMHYVMADSVEQLTRAKTVYRYSKAVRKDNGQLVESHGHNSIVERRGVYYNFFHQGFFNSEGRFTGKRNTYIQRMAFGEDGRPVSLNLVDLKWKALPNADYSLDLVLRSGEVIGPCLDAKQIARASSVTYTGICPSAGNRLVNKDQIAAFRLFWSDDGVWGGRYREMVYDGYSDAVSFAIQ